MTSANSISIGQLVLVTFPWRDTELPTDDNFFYGKVIEVIEKSVYVVYVRVEGLENLVPVDRVRVLDNRDEETEIKIKAKAR